MGCKQARALGSLTGEMMVNVQEVDVLRQFSSGVPRSSCNQKHHHHSHFFTISSGHLREYKLRTHSEWDHHWEKGWMQCRVSSSYKVRRGGEAEEEAASGDKGAIK